MRNVLLALAVIVSLLPGSPGYAEGFPCRVVAKLDTARLQLRYTVGEGGGNFAVLDSGVVVLAEDYDLLVVKNGVLARKVRCDCFVRRFSLDREGSGVVVCDSSALRVKNLQVAPPSVELDFPCREKVHFIDRVDLVDDSTIMLIPNYPQVVIFADVNSLGSNRYSVLTDSLSLYIAHHYDAYLGAYGREYFFLDFSGPGDAARVWTFEVQGTQHVNERTIDIGQIGDLWPMWAACPFDPKRGLFYTATLQEGCLVIREFDIRDFASKK